MCLAVAAIYIGQQLVDDRSMIYTHIGLVLPSLDINTSHHLMGKTMSDTLDLRWHKCWLVCTVHLLRRRIPVHTCMQHTRMWGKSWRIMICYDEMGFQSPVSISWLILSYNGCYMVHALINVRKKKWKGPSRYESKPEKMTVSFETNNRAVQEYI